MTTIAKSAGDWKVPPNYADYAKTRVQLVCGTQPVRRNAGRWLQYRLRGR